MTINRKQQEYEFKKNLIVSAAEEIFFTKGFENTTMVEIAHKVGYSKGSIYSYFKSKNEVCFCIVNNYFRSISDLAQDVKKKKCDGLQKLIIFKESFLKEFSTKDDFRKIFETFKYHRSQCIAIEEEIDRNKNYNREINLAIRSYLEEGMRDGSIKQSIDIIVLANALWGEEVSFISELGTKGDNNFIYLFDLIIDSIKHV